jgi:hypothetical protein
LRLGLPAVELIADLAVQRGVVDGIGSWLSPCVAITASARAFELYFWITQQAKPRGFLRL